MRIVSINTGKGDGAYRRRVALLAEGLAALDPDVVLLQEVLKTRDGVFDTAGEVANEIGCFSAMIPARWKPRVVEGAEVECWSGMAVLSRQQAEVHAVELPRDDRDGDRIAAIARIGDFAIANVHLTHLRDAAALRRRQLETLLADPALTSATHRIVAGDFNTPLQQIRPLVDGIGEWQLIDCFDEAEPDRATIPVSATAGSGYCVDYVFAALQPGDTAPEFANSAVVLGKADASGIYPSDHRGILTDVTFAEQTKEHQ